MMNTFGLLIRLEYDIFGEVYSFRFHLNIKMFYQIKTHMQIIDIRLMPKNNAVEFCVYKEFTHREQPKSVNLAHLLFIFCRK